MPKIKIAVFNKINKIKILKYRNYNCLVKFLMLFFLLDVFHYFFNFYIKITCTHSEYMVDGGHLLSVISMGFNFLYEKKPVHTYM